MCLLIQYSSQVRELGMKESTRLFACKIAWDFLCQLIAIRYIKTFCPKNGWGFIVCDEA